MHKTELSLAGGGEIDLASNTPEAGFLKKHALRPDQQDSKVKIVLEDGARIIAYSNSPDLYIYCMSSEYNPEVMKQFKCDACMEIINPEAFFTAISRRIRHR